MKGFRTETFPFKTGPCGHGMCGLASELGGCENLGGSGWQQEIVFKKVFLKVRKSAMHSWACGGHLCSG